MFYSIYWNATRGIYDFSSVETAWEWIEQKCSNPGLRIEIDESLESGASYRGAGGIQKLLNPTLLIEDNRKMVGKLWIQKTDRVKIRDLAGGM